MKTEKNTLVYQFKVTLQKIEPSIWRRIQVPGNYSFWDLHVAIQDAMGWLDYHLHAFRIHEKYKHKMIEIGIPGDEMDDDNFLPGWEIPIRDYFREPGESIPYEYDFGDRWEHAILLEGILLKEKGVKYPRCIGGERACPPEDCGSVPGYYHLLEVIRNPKHKEYGSFINWLKGHAKNYYPYDPEKFEPNKAHFDSPKKRWKMAFSEEDRR
jgi:hypothetical protein